VQLPCEQHQLQEFERPHSLHTALAATDRTAQQLEFPSQGCSISLSASSTHFGLGCTNSHHRGIPSGNRSLGAVANSARLLKRAVPRLQVSHLPGASERRMSVMELCVSKCFARQDSAPLQHCNGVVQTRRLCWYLRACCACPGPCTAATSKTAQPRLKCWQPCGKIAVYGVVLRKRAPCARNTPCSNFLSLLFACYGKLTHTRCNEAAHLCLLRRCSSQHLQLRLQHLPWSVAAAELAPQLLRHTLACPAGQQCS